MIPADFERIENSIKGSCATSANTIERVAISCLKLDGNEDSLCATLKDMGFHKIHVQVSGISLIVTAERIIKKASDEATESREQALQELADQAQELKMGYEAAADEAESK